MKNFSSLSIPTATRTVLIALLGAGAASVSLSAAAPWKSRPAATRNMTSGFAAQPLAADALRPNERAFLLGAVKTSREQMRLAEVGASKADSSEVRSHALQLVADYRQLSDALDVLIRRKGGLPGAPVGDTSQNYQKLAEKSGADFDREFVRTLADLSNDVMSLFEQAAADAKDTDVRELAAAQLPILRAHRNTVVELKKTFD